MKTLYIPCQYLGEAGETLGKNLQLLQGMGKIGLTATAQHLDNLDEVASILKEEGKEIVFKTQVLGCKVAGVQEAAGKADCFIHIGSGRFHPIAVAAATGKPVYMLNPISRVMQEITPAEVEEYGRKKKRRIMRAAGAKTFGILVSTKWGQEDLSQAMEIREKLIKHGYKAYVFMGDQLTPQNTVAFKVDCWINTACPRIAEDEFDKPVLNPGETDFLFGQALD